MNDELSETEIVRGLRQGERRAWDVLCRRYAPRVWSHVARLVGGNEQAVADVVQETFLAVARAGRNLTEETHLWAWLAKIGHNQAALYWRQQYRQPRTGENGDLPGRSPGGDPSAVLESVETVQCVRLLLAEMSPEHVAVLTARYLDELTVPQMVELLGGTLESVRSRLARARRDFRERYERMTAERHPGNRAATFTEKSPLHRGDLP